MRSPQHPSEPSAAERPTLRLLERPAQRPRSTPAHHAPPSSMWLRLERWASNILR